MYGDPDHPWRRRDIKVGKQVWNSTALEAAEVAKQAGVLQLIRSYVRFFRSADELLQKFDLEGLAFGFGAGRQVEDRVAAPVSKRCRLQIRRRHRASG